MHLLLEQSGQFERINGEMAEIKVPLVSLEEMEFEEPIQPPASLRRRIAVKPMVLMGTGPTNPSKRVTEALIKPVMGIYTDEYNQVNQIHQYHNNERIIRLLITHYYANYLHEFAFHTFTNGLAVLWLKNNYNRERI